MQTYYAPPEAAPVREKFVSADWMRMSRVENSSWDSSVAELLSGYYDNDASSSSYNVEGTSSAEYSWGPPTPPLDRDPSSSDSSASSPMSLDFEDLPEIPFISAADSAPVHRCEDRDSYSLRDDNISERSFWSNLVRQNRSRTDSSDRPVALLGQTHYRVVSPSRCRAPSVSSTTTTSSRSRPAPAKSILSSSSSIRTRTGRSPPSVKFLDMPTIHYEEENECDYDDDYDNNDEHASQAGPEGRPKFAFIRRLLRSKKDTEKTTQGRPVISGPYPLWDRPSPARTPVDRRKAASLRSVRSNGSLRSIRSCSSRLQTYLGRLNGKEP
ncbi:hypothetical protein K474DRAFT_1711668 [Panus rudis PR-1116 ss-1]|nr:hypothetical protein K474DRAFT_1711668 [Panus rudis PR-1116 ss-1]